MNITNELFKKELTGVFDIRMIIDNDNEYLVQAIGKDIEDNYYNGNDFALYVVKQDERAIVYLIGQGDYTTRQNSLPVVSTTAKSFEEAKEEVISFLAYFAL